MYRRHFCYSSLGKLAEVHVFVIVYRVHYFLNIYMMYRKEYKAEIYLRANDISVAVTLPSAFICNAFS